MLHPLYFLFLSYLTTMQGKKVSVLLTVIGKTMFALLKNLLVPKAAKDKSLTDLMKVLESHFEPKPLIIAECFNFY